MMRDVGKKIKVNKYVEVEEVVVKEKIIAIFVKPDTKTLEITFILINTMEEVVDEKTVILYGDDYDFLYSSDSFFGEGKQEGSYREVDLWKMIDKVSAS